MAALPVTPSTQALADGVVNPGARASPRRRSKRNESFCRAEERRAAELETVFKLFDRNE
jgi:hypothetical protein